MLVGLGGMIGCQVRAFVGTHEGFHLCGEYASRSREFNICRDTNRSHTTPPPHSFTIWI